MILCQTKKFITFEQFENGNFSYNLYTLYFS